jgi:uncharacterized membrane protein
LSYEPALFFHLAGAFTFVSGAAVAAAAHAHARRRQDPAEIALVLALARAGVVLVGAGGLVTLVFGLLLVHVSGHHLGEAWLIAAVALFAASFVLGAVGGRRPRQARMLASQLAARRQPVSAELRQLLDDRASAVANLLSAAAIVAILALMVWKPGG